MLSRRVAIVAARSGMIAQKRSFFCHVTPMRLGLPPFGLFMKRVAKHPKLRGVGAPKRGKLLGQMYRALPEAEKEKLRKDAAKMKSPKRRSGWKCSKPKKPHVYAKFVKAHYNQFRKLPYLKRLGAIAQLWKTEKKEKLAKLAAKNASQVVGKNVKGKAASVVGGSAKKGRKTSPKATNITVKRRAPASSSKQNKKSVSKNPSAVKRTAAKKKVPTTNTTSTAAIANSYYHTGTTSTDDTKGEDLGFRAVPYEENGFFSQLN